MYDDLLCDYDEAYNRFDAYEIGWCLKCGHKQCPFHIKAVKEHYGVSLNEV